MKDIRQIRLALVFVIICVAAGALVGGLTAPGEWYAGLVKPSFNPPKWIFAPVWTVLYVMIGFSGSVIWGRAPQSAAMKLWFGQMAVNLIWPFVFFSLHRIDMALDVIFVLLAFILAFIAQSWRIDRMAALMFLPYGLWVSFASILNLALYDLN